MIPRLPSSVVVDVRDDIIMHINIPSYFIPFSLLHLGTRASVLCVEHCGGHFLLLTSRCREQWHALSTIIDAIHDMGVHFGDYHCCGMVSIHEKEKIG